jgi:hypothetical protein
MLVESSKEVWTFATCVWLQENHFGQYAIDRIRPPVKSAHGDASKTLPVQ